MSIFKVSIFQKSLTEGLNLSVFKRLASLKSDFLLLPEFFFADMGVKDYQSAADKSQYALDWLLKLNESYKGVIIGGSIVQKEDDKLYNSTPIISNGEVIDWYRKRNLTPEESQLVSPGSEPGIFILKGHRFAVLSGADIQNPQHFQELADMDVKIVFVVMNDCSNGHRELNTDPLSEAAAKHGLYITRCCSTGTVFGTPSQGRSMVVTPRGISWRVSPEEEDKEILMTIMLSVSEQS